MAEQRFTLSRGGQAPSEAQERQERRSQGTRLEPVDHVPDVRDLDEAMVGNPVDAVLLVRETKSALACNDERGRLDRRE
jgi:hypothetical protein